MLAKLGRSAPRRPPPICVCSSQLVPPALTSLRSPSGPVAAKRLAGASFAQSACGVNGRSDETHVKCPRIRAALRRTPCSCDAPTATSRHPRRRVGSSGGIRRSGRRTTRPGLPRIRSDRRVSISAGNSRTGGRSATPSGSTQRHARAALARRYRPRRCLPDRRSRLLGHARPGVRPRAATEASGRSSQPPVRCSTSGSGARGSGVAKTTNASESEAVLKA